MSQQRYERPSAPPAPPIDGLVESDEGPESFAQADLRERTDPWGLERDARPSWLDPTPPPRARMPRLELGSLPPGPQDDEDDDLEPAMWPWVVVGLLLGSGVALAGILWFAAVVHFDSEGLVALPDAVSDLPVGGLGHVTR